MFAVGNLAIATAITPTWGLEFSEDPSSRAAKTPGSCHYRALPKKKLKGDGQHSAPSVKLENP
jgi:hypothetical protein